MNSRDRYWLAGLLEGEGSFQKPSPAHPNQLRIYLTMTDKDIVERAARIMGTSVMHRAPAKEGYKDTYRTVAHGNRARSIMQELRPEMGARRREAIDKALAAYDPTSFVRSYFARSDIKEPQAAEMAELHSQGFTWTQIGHGYRCDHKKVKRAVHRYQALRLVRAQAESNPA